MVDFRINAAAVLVPHFVPVALPLRCHHLDWLLPRQLVRVLRWQPGRRRDDRAVGFFRRRVHGLGDLIECWVHLLPVLRDFGAVCPLQ